MRDGARQNSEIVLDPSHIDLEIRVKPLNDCSNALRRRRKTGRAMYQQLQTRLLRGTRRQVRVRLVSSCQVGRLHILRDADHFYVGSAFPADDFADGVLIRPKMPHRGFGHDRDRCSRAGLGLSEIASPHDRNSQYGKEFRGDQVVLHAVDGWISR